MFSIAPHPKSRAAAPKSNNHNMQTPRGFAVRVFKGPTFASFPYTATAKFDVGYRPTANSNPRQSQNWYSAGTELARQPPASSREPPKPGSWTENRGGRDTPRPSNYADFIYEPSLSSKSDIYSENDTSSTTTFTPSTTFSPPLSANSSMTSTPSQVPYQSPTTSASTVTASSPRHPFPLHIPALAQAQSALRGLFVHPNGDIGQQPRDPSPSPPVPAAPVSRPADLPASSPPRFFPADASARSTSPTRAPLTESPQSISATPAEYFPPPASESEVGEAERLAILNAQQYNSASSAYYQAGLRASDNGREQNRENTGYSSAVNDSRTRGRERSPERAAQMGSSSRSLASSSIPTDSIDSQNHIVYESSSLAENPPTFMNIAADPTPIRLSPTASQQQPRVAFAGSDSSSVTAVESDVTRWRDSHRTVPVSQLVEIGSPTPADRERARVMSDPGRYEELRGLNILSERQREAYVSAFAPGTQLRGIPMPEIPAVVRSDSSGGGGDGRSPTVPQRTRRTSGNLWSSLSGLPDQRSPVQLPSRPSSTPPLPRIDTSRVSVQLPPPENRPAENVTGRRQQSPPRREVQTQPQPPPPQTALATISARTWTPVAGPRVLPAEPQRRRSDGDQPLNAPSLLKRTSAIFHRSSSPENAVTRAAPAPRPSRPGNLPLEPQRRRSDGFQSVVPPRPPTPAGGATAPRNVRWNENLVCPSPIFPSQRRKGWFNRRGDQLWTNDGAYKPPPQGQEYPPDLRDYPPHGSGWMNEDGVRIDMGHRLVPKAPLRSALKQTQSRGPVIQVTNGK